jgi:hypothetical protein
MRIVRGGLLVICALVVGCSGESGTPPDDSAPSVGDDGTLPLSGAGYDTDGEPAAVVDKYWQASDVDHRAGVRIGLPGGGSCSGFLINDQTVVTAGHCVSPWAGTGKSGTFNINLSIDEPGGAFRSLGNFNAHFWFNADTLSQGDIGVIRTDTWIGNGIDADNFVLIPQTTQSPSGTNWSFGYGLGSPTSTASNNQRMAVNTVGSVSALSYVVSGGTGLACNGDSGGPALVGTNSAWDLVYGVHSASSPVDPLGICAANASASQYKANLSTGSTFVALALQNDSGNSFKCANWTTPAGQRSMWCWQLK